MAEPSSKGQRAVGAGSGAVTGTALLALAQRLPDDSRFKPFAIFASPATGSVLAVVGTFIAEYATDKWVHHRANVRHYEAVGFQQSILHDPFRSKDEQNAAREELSVLNKEYGDYLNKRRGLG